jgi:hypothetical protein
MDIRDRIVELRRVPASELAPNPRNWRRHPPAQWEALRAVVDEIGFADALLARESPHGLVLIDGHLRRDFAQDGTVPVLIVDLSEEEADVLMASLDPLAAMALTDEEALEELLASAAIPEEMLVHLQASLSCGTTGRTDPDQIPERPPVPTTRPGELWALGRHRLLCGDATKAEDLTRLMGTRPADLLWTDPPYGVDYVGKTGRALTIRNDRAEGLERLLAEAFAAIDGVMRPGAACT